MSRVEQIQRKADQVSALRAALQARRTSHDRAVEHVERELEAARARLVGDEATQAADLERITAAVTAATEAAEQTPTPEHLVKVRRLAAVEQLQREWWTLRNAEARLNQEEALVERTIAALKP